MLEHALRYAEKGWKVFPVNKNKKPLTPNGFKDASTKPQVIKQFWKRFPDANIGIATGKQSNLVVIDIDSKKPDDVERIVVELTKLKGSFHQNVVARTGGGGFHFYFEHPGTAWVKSPTDAFGIQGLDIRADGAYVVAPPSQHLSGELYVWGDDQSPFEAKLPLSPSFILDVSRAKSRNLLNDVSGKITAGNRNTTLASIAGLCRSLGLDNESILEILNRQNIKRCDTPLGDYVIQMIYVNIDPDS